MCPTSIDSGKCTSLKISSLERFHIAEGLIWRGFNGHGILSSV